MITVRKRGDVMEFEFSTITDLSGAPKVVYVGGELNNDDVQSVHLVDIPSSLATMNAPLTRSVPTRLARALLLGFLPLGLLYLVSEAADIMRAEDADVLAVALAGDPLGAALDPFKSPICRRARVLCRPDDHDARPAGSVRDAHARGHAA